LALPDWLPRTRALPLEQAMTEVAEETGLDADTVTLVLAPPPSHLSAHRKGGSG